MKKQSLWKTLRNSYHSEIYSNMITKFFLDFLQAVQILLASRATLSKETSEGSERNEGENRPEVDPIQVHKICKYSVSDIYQLKSIYAIASR